MIKIKQFLDFELNFLSNRIPYIKANGTNGKTNYFCIYRCFYNEGIIIYRIEPNSITVIKFENNGITEVSHLISVKVKPIVTIDQKTGKLYFLVKETDGYYRIYSCCFESGPHPHCCLERKKILKNYFSKLLVYKSRIFIAYQDTLYFYNNSKSKIAIKKKYKKNIIASTCNDKLIALLFEDHSITFFGIYSLKDENNCMLAESTLKINPALFFFYNDTLHIYSINDRYIIEKKITNAKDNWNARGLDLNIYSLYAIQEINSNFINKYMKIENNNVNDNAFEKSKKYINVLSFVSEICFPDDSYEGDVLFFGPSIYLPFKKDACDSLYSKLNKFKEEILFSNKQFFEWLDEYSKSGNINTLELNIKGLLSDVKASVTLDANEVSDLLRVIKLPDKIEEESVIHSSLMPNFLCFIIAEIVNSFINLLIIKGLEENSIVDLDDEIKVYSSLYRLITSDLVQYNYNKNSKPKKEILNEKDDHEINDDDDDEKNDDNVKNDDDDDDDNENSNNSINDGNNNNDNSINSCLYILNSSFSPHALRNQLWFLYKGNTTLTKLSNSNILEFNKICPEPFVEQRILDVARAYLETDKFEICIEYLKKINMDDESLGPIQNIYISNLLKQINNYEYQFKLLQTLNKRLPKNMYKSLYVISLKANQFSAAVDQFFSKDALSNLVREVNKSEELQKYIETIKEVLADKDCEEAISLMKE